MGSVFLSKDLERSFTDTKIQREKERERDRERERERCAMKRELT